VDVGVSFGFSGARPAAALRAPAGKARTRHPEPYPEAGTPEPRD